jgi:hypothetical protein
MLSPPLQPLSIGHRLLSYPAGISERVASPQAVWNALHGFDSRFGIKDYDLVYVDRHDLSEQAENRAESRARHLVTDLGVQLDVTNEARVHLWYEEQFGRPIAPYQSSEDAIATWPTTATSVGVRRSHGAFELAGRCDRGVSQVTRVDSILCQYP